MDFNKLNKLKGFMPLHEGEALARWSKEFSTLGPALEIGTFGGKSSLFIAAGTSQNKQVVFTIDHHSGSEEHQNGEEYFDADIYETVASDLSDLEEIFYDMIVFFSPLGLKSLFINFPDFEQKGTRIAAFGPTTSKAVVEHGLKLNVKAPAPESPSMTMAIHRYIKSLTK